MDKKLKLQRKKKKIRAKIKGTKARPRLSVYRSLKHIYAQLIDDEEAKTLVAASDAEITSSPKSKGAIKGKVDLSFEVGKILAEKAKKKGIKKVIFDRGGRKYHGRVKSLAEGARKAGLEF